MARGGVGIGGLTVEVSELLEDVPKLCGCLFRRSGDRISAPKRADTAPLVSGKKAMMIELR